MTEEREELEGGIRIQRGGGQDELSIGCENDFRFLGLSASISKPSLRPSLTNVDFFYDFINHILYDTLYKLSFI